MDPTSPPATEEQSRYCPACRNEIGSDLDICPVCGVTVRTARILKTIRLLSVVVMICLIVYVWHICHK